MMWELGKPSMRDRVLALSALFIALLLFVFGLVVPYLALLENSYEQLAQSQQQRALFARYMEKAGQSDDAMEQTGALHDLLLLPGSTVTNAQAGLQQIIDGLAGESGVSLLSFEPLSSEGADNGFGRVGGRVRATADLAGLQRFLHGLESHRPVLFLDRLYVRARTPQGQESDGLDVQLDIFGFRAQAGAAPS